MVFLRESFKRCLTLSSWVFVCVISYQAFAQPSNPEPVLGGSGVDAQPQAQPTSPQAAPSTTPDSAVVSGPEAAPPAAPPGQSPAPASAAAPAAASAANQSTGSLCIGSLVTFGEIFLFSNLPPNIGQTCSQAVEAWQNQKNNVWSQNFESACKAASSGDSSAVAAGASMDAASPQAAVAMTNQSSAATSHANAARAQYSSCASGLQKLEGEIAQANANLMSACPAADLSPAQKAKDLVTQAKQRCQTDETGSAGIGWGTVAAVGAGAALVGGGIGFLVGRNNGKDKGGGSQAAAPAASATCASGMIKNPEGVCVTPPKAVVGVGSEAEGSADVAVSAPPNIGSAQNLASGDTLSSGVNTTEGATGRSLASLSSGVGAGGIGTGESSNSGGGYGASSSDSKTSSASNRALASYSGEGGGGGGLGDASKDQKADAALHKGATGSKIQKHICRVVAKTRKCVLNPEWVAMMERRRLQTSRAPALRRTEKPQQIIPQKKQETRVGPLKPSEDPLLQ